jgi:hypothetical protein
LPLFGMKFNTEKSYTHSWFRESCGLHAYKGVEITPEYFKYLPNYHSPRDVVLSLLSTEARLFRKGYNRTAALVRSELQKVKCIGGYEFPYVRPKSPILGWIREDKDAPSCRHIGLKRRWNTDSLTNCVIDGRVIAPEDRCCDDTFSNTPNPKGNGYWEVRALVARPSQDTLSIERENEAYLRNLCDWGNSHIEAYKPHKVIRSSGDGPLYDHANDHLWALNPTHRFALADHTKTSVDCKEVKDFGSDPPWIRFEWIPESAL